MKSFLFAIVVLFASSHFALCIEQPFMQEGLKYLEAASKPNPHPSPLGTTKKVDRIGLLNSARASLAKAPSIYKGRKADAEKFIALALEQLNAGKDDESLPTIQKAIAKVNEGIALVDGGKGSVPSSKPDKNSPANSGQFFGNKN